MAKGKQQHNISAKSFSDPLLLTLGELSGFRPNKPVNGSATHEPTCSRMSLTLDQFGKPKGVNSYWTVRWIQGAFKNLIKEGLASREGSRGKWKLTPEGVAQAQELRSPDKPGTEVPPLYENVPEEVYQEDPYIRTLVLEQTPCLGAFSEKSDVCTTCPVKNHCFNAMSAHYSRLAVFFAKEDAAAAEAGKTVEEKTAEKIAKTSISPPSPNQGSAKANAGKSPISKITCQQAALCKKCGEKIERGDKATWVRAIGSTPATKPPGMYHPNCFEEI